MRATLRLSSPAWLAQPSSTSSMACGVDPGASHQRADDDRRQVVGAHLGQRAAVPADRRPQRVDDEDLAHVRHPAAVIVSFTQGAGRMGGRSMARRVRCSSISLISTAGATVDTGT